VTTYSDEMTAGRWINLDGAGNVRDLGGLATSDGRTTRPGRLIRSDTPQMLTAGDVHRLVDGLGLRTVIDLRTPGEARREGRGPLADTAVTYRNIPFLPDSYLVPGDPEHRLIVERRAREEQADHYLEYVERPGSPVADAVRLLTQADALPALFHCATGKDRTGVLAALVLELVGVPRETIVADYVLTNERIRQVQRRLADRDTYQASANRDISVKAATMYTFLARVDATWGGAEAWARQAGLTDAELAALRDALLIPAAGSPEPGRRPDTNSSRQIVVPAGGSWLVWPTGSGSSSHRPPGGAQVTTISDEATADRWINLDGAANVRDLGGLATSDGRMTRPGRLIRSDTLQMLTAGDVHRLVDGLGLRTVIDLRSPTEARREGRGPLADTAVDYENIPFLPDSYVVPGDPEHRLIVERRARREQADHYLEYVQRPGSPVAEAVHLLARPGTLPALFHCAAGKDRTGVLAALVLELVGVPRETIVADYVLTNERIRRVKDRLVTLDTYKKSADRDITVQDAAMYGFLERVDATWGGTEAWARQAGITDVELTALRDALLS
jgi:protein tyrosine/serine phosphatase